MMRSVLMVAGVLVGAAVHLAQAQAQVCNAVSCTCGDSCGCSSSMCPCGCFCNCVSGRSLRSGNNCGCRDLQCAFCDNDALAPLNETSGKAAGNPATSFGGFGPHPSGAVESPKQELPEKTAALADSPAPASQSGFPDCPDNGEPVTFANRPCICGRAFGAENAVVCGFGEGCHPCRPSRCLPLSLRLPFDEVAGPGAKDPMGSKCPVGETIAEPCVCGQELCTMDQMCAVTDKPSGKTECVTGLEENGALVSGLSIAGAKTQIAADEVRCPFAAPPMPPAPVLPSQPDDDATYSLPL